MGDNLTKQAQTQQYIEVLTANIASINSLAATIRGTVGPKGLDVMLVDQYGDYSCTNDGVEILSKIEINHPAAKLAIEVAKAQEDKVGDGTTTATILTDSILTEALLRIKSGMAANRLVAGIKLASDAVISHLKEKTYKVASLDDKKLFDLCKISARGNDEIASLLIKAAKKLESTNLLEDPGFDFSRVVKSSDLSESKVLDGLFIKKKPHFDYQAILNDAPVLVIEGAFEAEAIPQEAVKTDEGVKKYSSNVEALNATAKKIVQAGIKAVFIDASIFPNIEEYLVKEGVFVLSRVLKEDLRKLALSSGAKMVTRQSLFGADTKSISQFSGQLKKLEFNKELHGVLVSGQELELATLIISAETPSATNEKERICIDAAKALQAAFRSGYLIGEGVAELNARQALDKICQDKKIASDVLAGIEIVKESLKSLFKQIINNAGLDEQECLEKVEAASNPHTGINLENGELVDLLELGVLDPLEVKVNALKIASETACQILKINLVLQAKNV